jgi:uncharacterized protein YceK
MRIIALLLMVFALVTGCAGARADSPSSSVSSYATATDRNLAGTVYTSGSAVTFKTWGSGI